MDDEQLDVCMQATQRGQGEAFDQVVEALHRCLRWWLAARCEPALDPDEIAHVSFVHAFRHAASYQPGTCVRAWLWAIARNQLLAARTGLLRRRHRERELPTALAQELADDLADAPERDEQELSALRQCVDRLGSGQQALLAGYYRDGEDCPGLAVMAGSTAGAIRKRLCLIRRALRSCIERSLARGTVDG